MMWWSACHHPGSGSRGSSEKGTVIYKRAQLITKYRCQRMMLTNKQISPEINCIAVPVLNAPRSTLLWTVTNYM